MNDYTITKIPLIKLFADEEFNCRGKISPLDVTDLAKSIDKDGLLQPIIVRPLTSDEKIVHDDKEYAIVAGFCRHMAHIVLKRDEIQCIIRKGLNEKSARILNLSENLGRKDLNIVQEARALLPLIAMGMNEYKIAEALPNTSRGWVQVRKMLLKLPKAIQDDASAGLITQTDIRDLTSIRVNNGTEEDMFEACKRIKDAKRSKNKVAPPTRKMPPEKAKRIRKRPELFKLINHILDHVDAKQSNISPQFATRCLSWAAGEISDLDIFCDIREVCEKQDKLYTLPKVSI